MGDCVTTLQLPKPGTPPQETVHQLIRAGDGKMRVDTGNISVISDPANQKTILLDHVKKEAKTLSMVAEPQLPQVQMPGMPQLTPPTIPGMPATPPANVQDLGKRMIDGEEAEGKRIIFQRPEIPSKPNLPSMPAVPSMPGVPTVPGMPSVVRPAVPPQPTVAEIWTNPNLHLPVLTQVKGDFGQQTCKCKNKAIPEPDPSLFKIPADYKDLTPASTLPRVPQK
jgi:hypothetical protein